MRKEKGAGNIECSVQCGTACYTMISSYSLGIFVRGNKGVIVFTGHPAFCEAAE